MIGEEMKYKCPPFQDMDRLAMSASAEGVVKLDFLQHVQNCPRCQYLWVSLTDLHQQYRGMTTGSEDQKNGSELEVAKKLIITLVPLPEPDSKTDSHYQLSKLAADTDISDETELTEFSILASKSHGVFLRVLQHRVDSSFHFYLYSENYSPHIFKLFLPGLNEPLKFDDEGYAKLTGFRLSEKPFIALLVSD